MAALSSLIATLFWMVIILAAVNSAAKKRKKNNWSRTPQSNAEKQAEQIRNYANISSPAASGGGSYSQGSSGQSSAQWKTRGTTTASNAASRARYDGAVSSYSNSNVSGLDKSLQRERGSKSLRDLSDFFGEDRKNDWMARQLKEERRILITGSALDLGASHAADCDADDLKASHRRVHQDAIDTGEKGKTINRRSSGRQFRG